MSMAHGGMAATTSSSFNFRTQQYVGNRPTSPTGLVQLEAPNFMKYRKRNLSFGSAIDLAKHNPSWIRKNIGMKVCIRFTPVPINPAKPDPEPDNPLCQCGKRKFFHEERFHNNIDPKAPWKSETHTQNSKTNAFGEIEFIGAAGAGLGLQLRKFVRVNHDIHPHTMLQLLNKQWNLGTPKLLISVTGGANNFHMSNKLKSVFRKGLIKAALSTGAWIITGGSNSGIMKYVGDAIRDYALASGNATRTNVVAIGIATWGVIDQRDKLINEKGQFPATYRMDTKNRKGVLLDPNHTHFILADDGTNGQFGKEIKLRGKMEKEISEQKVAGNPDVSVPIVCVVVEGGPNTIATVFEAIMNGTPAVIVAGSGRAADILAFAFQRAPVVERQVKDAAGNIRKEKKTVISDSLSKRLAAMLSKEFGDAELDTHLTRIKEMLNRRHLITVYELGAGSDIDSAILHALLSANKGSVQDQLQLALTWNRVDVAKREIFIDDRDWTKGDLDKALHYALVNNLVDFVRLFIENGVSLKDYLTIAELTSLYNEVKERTLLYELLDKHRSKTTRSVFDLIDVGKVIQELTMDTFKPLYLSRDFKKKLNEAREGASIGSRETLNVGAGILPIESTEKPKRDFYNPIRELFLFSILQNRDEMARMLWDEGKEALASALTASKILKSMASKEADHDQSTMMKLHAASYEEVALGVLGECYANNQDHTSLLLACEQKNWGKSTNLNLAKQAENKNFIAHSGVQKLLTEIWNGKLSDENNYWLVWLCSFIPPLIPCLIRFREDEIKDRDLKQRKRKSSKKKQSITQERSYKVVEETNEDIQMQEMEDATIKSNQEDNGDAEVNSSSNNTNDTSEDPLTKEEHYHETADIDITNSGQTLSWWQRFSLFYNAPVITFRHSVLSYFIFLLLYSYIILVDFTVNISIFEYVLIVWVGSLYLEELRQIAQGEANSWRVRFWYWITDYWNMVDLATLLLFAVGIALRFFENFVDYARIILALDLAVFYIRILQIFSVSKKLGPKLIMIAKMMVDLAFFIAILSVFLVAYGVASQAILFPNGSSFHEVISGVFFKAYFQMYGELFLEDIQGNNGCSNDLTLIEAGAPRCAEYSTIGVILLAVYMMLSNVLLLNLLIAMFSYTFSAVQENTDVYWRFQRYDLIKEYFNRPAIVPPFIIIAHVFFLCRFLIQKICGCCISYRSGQMRQHISDSKARQLILWEAIQSDDFITQERRLMQSDINKQVMTTGERVEDLLGKMEELFADPETGMPSRALGLLGEKAMEERLNRLEDQMERTNQAIDWIITSLRDHKLGSLEGPPMLKEIKPREVEENYTSESEERKVPSTLEELGITLHHKARSSPYPGTAIGRSPVPDEKVPWEVSFHFYKPVSYTHESILALPHFADIDLLKYSKSERPMLNFNMLDKSVNYDRVSFMGHYNVTDGVPQNPRGRTGMIGRGLLGRFGPNHAADPIVTRWKKNSDGVIIEDNGQKVLEFVAVQRKDNQQWAIPGGMVEPGDVVSATLKREFGEEALGSMEKSMDEVALLAKKIEDLFSNGVEIYKGYVDDPRNTDNAWMETVAMNFHDEDGTSVSLLELQAGDDAQGVRWQRVSSNIRLFASHQAMLRKVAELHNAAF
ncbi:transient receptor potential cation channel subfamily M member-like 2 isoform X2 [Asterias rubens]|uniref:transient receptor potential cation channel subfamily M member-like 2 isoform X2 n=1 Tax=Asterias rubens TaxID=7604 RepID=UPI0014554AAB|nr:transient receptor potential cation channel subfamily M member-like 2 isoform X2 [Asterias rubens]